MEKNNQDRSNRAAQTKVLIFEVDPLFQKQQTSAIPHTHTPWQKIYFAFSWLSLAMMYFLRKLLLDQAVAWRDCQISEENKLWDIGQDSRCLDSVKPFNMGSSLETIEMS